MSKAQSESLKVLFFSKKREEKNMSEEFKKKAMDIAVEVAKSAARSFLLQIIDDFLNSDKK